MKRARSTMAQMAGRRGFAQRSSEHRQSELAHAEKDANQSYANAFASPAARCPSPAARCTDLFQKIKAIRADFAKKKFKIIPYCSILFHLIPRCPLLRTENCKSHDARAFFERRFASFSRVAGFRHVSCLPGAGSRQASGRNPKKNRKESTSLPAFIGILSAFRFAVYFRFLFAWLDRSLSR